jgi:3-phosphoshikimate 1-carboxyvinyltransferase
MILRVSPSQLSGVVAAPPAKSIAQRLLAASLLVDGETWIHNPSESDDCTAAIALTAGLGAEIEMGETSLRIHGTGGRLSPRAEVLEVGESGLAFRLFTAIAGLSPAPVVLRPTGSLAGRPMDTLTNVLTQRGIQVSAGPQSGDLKIQGPFPGGDHILTMDGTLSSQFLTGLLMALPVAGGHTRIEVEGLTSRPYVEMTLEVLEDFGIRVDVNEDFSVFDIPGGQTYTSGLEMAVDGDWSGAAALMVAGMLAAAEPIHIEGLANQYTQADEAIRGALLFAGGAMSGTDSGVQVAARPVRAFSVDLNHSPDLFPVLAALAVFGNKPSTLKGIGRLTHKESNRAQAIAEEFAHAGIQIDLKPDADEMVVHPAKKGLKPARLNARGDHRMAMAAAILGLAGVPIEIDGAECVAKSYPAFFDDLETLGASIAWVSKTR